MPRLFRKKESTPHHPGDLQVIAQMNMGWDLTAERLVEHFLYFPTEAAAQDVGATLRSRGYDAQIAPGADGVNWVVQASVRIVVAPEAITSQRRELTELAPTKGGEYDGWGAPE